ncbi:MAG: hypothetical protein PVI03_06200 [Candidatus Thorarchaeota archaeon]
MTDRKNRNQWKRIARRIAKSYSLESIYHDYPRRPDWPCIALRPGLYKQ